MTKWQKMKNPVKAKDVVSGFREIRREARQRVTIAVGAGKDGEAAQFVRALGLPVDAGTFSFATLSRTADPTRDSLVNEADCLIIVVTNEGQLGHAPIPVPPLDDFNKPVIVVLQGLLSAPEHELIDRAEDAFGVRRSRVMFIGAADRAAATSLARKIADVLSGKEVALARSLSFMREPAARSIIRRTGLENAAISSMIFIAGPDLPILTMNQVRMALKIAAIYGDDIDAARLRELLAVVGGGFGFRAVARSLLGLLPGLGLVIRAGVAYAGTEALGAALIEYFKRGMNEIGMEDARRLLRRG